MKNYNESFAFTSIIDLIISKKLGSVYDYFLDILQQYFEFFWAKTYLVTVT